MILSARRLSGFNTAFGMTNGRPHVISALENLTPEKVRRVMLSHARPTDTMTPQLREVLKYVPSALDCMYEKWGVLKDHGTQPAEISAAHLDGAYLGSAAGSYFEKEHKYLISDDEDAKVTLTVKMGQKKVHSHHAVTELVQSFVTDSTPLPPSISTTNMKNEYFHSAGEKQKDEATFKKFRDKARTYEIVDEITVEMERITQSVRALLEKSETSSIAIGFKQGRGGIHRMAKKIRVTWQEEYKRAIGDGDVEKLDQSIHYIFLQLFYTMAGVYYKPGSAEYKNLMRVIHEVADRMSVRLVRFFKKQWAIIVGKMPSGAWMTSHGDSWIMALWYYLFIIMQINAAPADQRAAMYEDAIVGLHAFLVYADDSVTANARGFASLRFGYDAFTRWLSHFLSVKTRDVRPDVEFCCAVSEGGMLSNDSLVFLKLYMLRNRRHQSMETKYVPFRPLTEYQLKSVWGREAKDRDIYDFVLSLLGHSYGTHGTNYRAWSWLRSCYVAAMAPMDFTQSLATVIDRAYSEDTMTSKIRAAGMSLEDLSNGFPRWDALVSRCKYEPGYHIVSPGNQIVS